MKFIKTHKVLFAILVITIVIIIIGIVFFFKLSPDGKKDVYGNRLTDIEQHQITDETLTKMNTELGQTEGIQTVTSNIKGRLINIIIKVDATLPKETAMQTANRTLEYFKDEDKAYYDMQVFITTTEENTNHETEPSNEENTTPEQNTIYPMIGYKHKTTSTYIWKQE